MSKSTQQLRLKIQPVIERADEVAATVAKELPEHRGLAKAARGVAAASRNAERISNQLQRLIGWHQVPALFLLVSLGVFLAWGYWHFFHTSRLVIALSARDAVQLKTNVGRRVEITPKETQGSRDSIAMLQRGEVDLAFVQGGMDLPRELLSTELASTELVLFFMRERIENYSQIRKILTSSEGQGSHTLAQQFVNVWRLEDQIEFTFDWRPLTDDPSFEIDEDVDAIFVVKDPMSRKVVGAMPQLKAAGFRLATADVGAAQLQMPFLKPIDVPVGFLDPVSRLPAEGIASYSVATYLVARPQLTPRELAEARQLLSSGTDKFTANAFEPTFDRTSEIAQGVEAIVGLLIYVGVAFLALMGLDIVTYRRYFNELNMLVSLISMHQSSKDAYADDEDLRRHNILYLSVCSDLLGLISVITGYYTQENPSLLYNRLPETIHERSDALKINIQLKILHGITARDPQRQSDDNPPIATDDG